MFFFLYKKPSSILCLSLLVFFLLPLSLIRAQINLVPNPSFEDSVSVPLSHSEFSKCKSWYTVSGSPDYYSTYSPTFVPLPGASVYIPINCMGFQSPKKGNFYSGIGIRSGPTIPAFYNASERIGVKLLTPLIANHSYSFTLYYNLCNISDITTSQLSAYFSVNQFTVINNYNDTNFYFNYLQTQINHDNTPINDTLNWIPLTGCFIAQGGEEYMTIGNFKDGIKSSLTTLTTNVTPCSPTFEGSCWIYIDDVSLYDMGLYLSATCKNDTLICNGTSLNISNNSIKDSSVVSWSPSIAITCTNCTNPVANPTITTMYYLSKSICGARSKDSILVQVLTPTTQANAGNGSIICEGDLVQLGVADSSSYVTYSWQGSGGSWQSAINCSYCAQPLVSPMVSTTYTVQRTECTTVTTDTVRVIVDDCNPTYVIPNVFTPNYDGVNDTWGISFSTVNSRIKNFKMSIYNRWGLLVYSTNSELSTPISKWDGHTTSGEECGEGVYFYIVTFQKNEEHVLLKGHLSLFR